MRIPDDAVIPPEKLTRYLLLPRPWDDKSAFLSIAGFTVEDPEKLLAALRELVSRREAAENGSNDYGTFFRVTGELTGPNGRSLSVITIWLRLRSDGTFRFITLKPSKAGRR